MLKIVVLLMFHTVLCQAQSDAELLQELTKNNETQLLNKYKTIHSPWFEKQCLCLASQLGFTKMLECKVFDSEVINAYVFDNGHVYFSLAMMQQINNKHQWAAILAHENAHLELKHYIKMLKKIKKPGMFFKKSKVRKMLRKHEAQADKWSKERLKQRNFDYSQIYYFLTRVKKLKAKGDSKQHLALSKRIAKTSQDEIVNNKLIKNLAKIKP